MRAIRIRYCEDCDGTVFPREYQTGKTTKCPICKRDTLKTAIITYDDMPKLVK